MKHKKLICLLLTLSMLAAVSVIPGTAYAVESKNPVISGSYADPDIDWFDCKFWIFPTTDGIIDERDGWWGSKTFKAFSSEDTVDWTDHGVILDVEADTAEEAGVNEYGVQIAYSPWSYGHAWAPSIEKVGDKYFFYYVAAIKPEYMEQYAALVDTLDENGNVMLDDNGNAVQHYVDDKAIGVAYASSPAGPYTALEEPIVYPKMVQDAIGDYSDIPSVIDPSIFIDDDSTAYMTFGNWIPCIVKLSDDMLSADTSSIRVVSGIPTGWWSTDAYMESLVIFKRNGKYYFTWSSDGTASEDYRVCYGTANRINFSVTYKGTLLKKDASQGIYGTGHQSILYLPINDTYYISYGRLQANADGTLIENADRGNYREVCIDKIDFDIYGNASAVPTNTGVGALSSHSWDSGVTTKAATCSEAGVKTYTCTVCGDKKTEEIAKIEHTYSDYATPAAPAQPVAQVTNTPAATQSATVKKPKATSIKKLSKGKKSFKVTWKKVSGVSGYQVQYSTSKKFTKKTTKLKTYKGNKSFTKTISKLKGKKKYYVRIRTYKTVNGTKYYSSWSKVKSITTKK